MDGLESDAAEALRLAGIAPEQATVLARAVERAAVQARDPATRSIAARARGVAALQLRDLAAATTALRVAIRAAEQAGVPHLAGEARMTLAAALGVRGLPDRAIAEIDAALLELDGLAAARARTQRAAILQARGRPDEALEELRRAVPALRRHGDIDWQIRALSNRGLLLLARGVFGQAEADLNAALELCEQNSLDLAAAYAEQNLGCLLAARGDLAGALARFDAADLRYRRLGIEVGSLWLDRGGVLLSLRLVAEARSAAESALRIHLSQQRQLHVPEARLLLSTAALVAGDVSTALAAAEVAAREFRRLRRPEGVALARYARLQAVVERDGVAIDPAQSRRGATDRAAAGRPRPALEARIRRSATDLEAAGWPQPALEARILAGRLALDRGHRAAAHRDLALAARARRTGPADARARAWLAEGLLREASGRRRGALAALSTGLRIIEDHQETFGATELRAHVSLHGGSLARAGLRLAVAGGDPRAVLGWAERGRARAILLRSPAAPADPALARDLALLRTTMTEIADARAARRPTAALVTRQVALERSVAARTRVVPAEPGVRHGTAGRAPRGGASLPELTSALAAAGPHGAALVEYLVLSDELSAVCVAGGRVRLHRLGRLSPVRDDLDHLAFALSRLADPRASRASTDAARAVLLRVGNRLDDLLLRPLLAQVGDRALVIAPTGVLQSVPWAVLPSCAGRAVTVSPSAAVWLRASRRPRTATGPVVVVAGPGLPGARAEAEAVAALHAPDGAAGADLFEEPTPFEGSAPFEGSPLFEGSPPFERSALFEGPAASVAAVCAALDGARIAHIAAHGRLRADNPLFSSLLLADGPLVIYDLERLRVAPEHVVLAACESARSAVLAGEETVGLAVALLQQGTAALIAPLLAVPDADTEPLMLAHHRFCLSGSAPAESLAAAQLATARDARSGDTAAAVASAFICLGDGLTRLSAPAARRSTDAAGSRVLVGR